MREPADPSPDDEVIIHVPADMHAGVWANKAVINESENESTADLTALGPSHGLVAP